MNYDFFTNIVVADVYSKAISNVKDRPMFVKYYGKIEIDENLIPSMTRFVHMKKEETTYITRFMKLFMVSVLNGRKDLTLKELSLNKISLLDTYRAIVISNVSAFGLPFSDDVQFAFVINSLMKSKGMRKLSLIHDEKLVTGIAPFLLALPAVTLNSEIILESLFRSFAFKNSTQSVIEDLFLFVSNMLNGNDFSNSLAELSANVNRHRTSKFAMIVMKATEILTENYCFLETIVTCMKEFNYNANVLTVIAMFLLSFDSQSQNNIPIEIWKSIKDTSKFDDLTGKYNRWVNNQ